MSYVFVLDSEKRPANPVHPGQARRLLSTGKAAVYRRFPFTLILKSEVSSDLVEPLRVKLDPGSKNTGIAVVDDSSGQVVFAAELQHHGHMVKEAMDARRAIRRSRRNRHTRYRAARFANRRKSPQYLQPSLESRMANTTTWVQRLCRLAPITTISYENVRFDMQAMENPEISGVEYQQGELRGYEVREYLLDKWGRKCAYCGKENVPLQIEHIQPRALGGTNRVSNLAIACEKCNIAKGKQDIRDFLKNKPDLLKRILAQAKAPLKDAAAVNATRWMLFERLRAIGLPVEGGSGGRTKFNRTQRGLPKAHWIDAACVGASTPQTLKLAHVHPLAIKSMGHGTRQMCQTDKFGFPRQHRQRAKQRLGFRTGDMVRADIPTGKYAGRYVGRITIRHASAFKLNGSISVNPKYCTVLHHQDGYSYSYLPLVALNI